jgi:hypothetical protein
MTRPTPPHVPQDARRSLLKVVKSDTGGVTATKLAEIAESDGDLDENEKWYRIAIDAATLRSTKRSEAVSDSKRTKRPASYASGGVIFDTSNICQLRKL